MTDVSKGIRELRLVSTTCYPIKPTNTFVVPQSSHIFAYTGSLPPPKKKFSLQLAGPKEVSCSPLLPRSLSCRDLVWLVSIGMHPYDILFPNILQYTYILSKIIWEIQIRSTALLMDLKLLFFVPVK